MISSNVLLGLMCFSYLFPIGTVAYHYVSSTNPTISSVISKKECYSSNGVNYILLGMVVMGLLTVAYEVSRGEQSLRIRGLPILALLLGVYGVICFKDTEATQPMHMVFSTIVFVSMIAFMISQMWAHPSNHILSCLALVHIGITLTFSYCYATQKCPFGYEVGILLSFAVFYLYSHTLMETKEAIDTIQ